MERLEAIVSGRVQGVSFRYATRQLAHELKLLGWVRNLPDGRVQVLAEGERSALQSLLDFLYEGPRGAQVKQVDFAWRAPEGNLEGFSISYYGD